MLEQHSEETLDGTKKRTMQHDGLMATAVGTYIFQVETLRKIEVALDCGELPLATNGIAHIDVDFWTVESGIAFFDFIDHSVPIETFTKSSGCLFPNVVGTHRLIGVAC